jgi:DNA-binding CsgD family transcriptional regulator
MLTPREAEVLEAVAQGLSNNQVAERLGFTVHTVKFHLASIYRKLGVSNRTEAAGLFFQHLATPSVADAHPRSGARSAAEEERRAQVLTAPPVLELPLTRLRAGHAPSARGRQEQALGGELTAAVRRFAAHERVRADAIALAALAALLHRYTRLEELVVAGAAQALWLDVAGDPSFAELAHRVDRELAVAQLHQGRVHQGRGATNGAGPEDALQVAFGATARHTTCEFALMVEDEPEGLVAVSLFNMAIFEPPAMRQLLGHLLTLLEAGVRDPSRRVSTLDLLMAGERAQMVDEWNATARESPSCRADQLIGLQAGRRPTDTAVEFEGERLTFGELDARANGLARFLQSLGVGPDVLVAICVER